jgi:hypothetical protein
MLTSNIRIKQFLTDCVEKLPADHLSSSDTTCSICEEAFLQEEAQNFISKIKDCSHAFHRTCLVEWLDTEDIAKSCPTCCNDLCDKSDRREKSAKALEAAWDDAHREVYLEGGEAGMNDASVGGSDTEDDEILYDSSDEDELENDEINSIVEDMDSSVFDVKERIFENVDRGRSIEK